MNIEQTKLEELADNMLNVLKKNPKGIVGNTTLKKTMKLDDAEFYEVRNYLLDQGKVTKARGKGGSTILVNEVESDPCEIIPQVSTNEQALYEPLSKTLQKDWMPDNGYSKYSIVSITANQGSRRTGGKWTRPDITIVSRKSYVFTPATIEVTTFEIKPKGCLGDKTSVFEAASHSLFAQKSYLMFHVEQSQVDNIDKRTEELGDLCREFGLGLILFTDPANYVTFYPIIEAINKMPNPEQKDKFLLNQLPKKEQDEIKSWH